MERFSEKILGFFKNEWHMKRYPLVSFIILNWNGKKRLEKCLSSIQKLQYPNKEIIIVNNGSTDDSASFVKKYYPEITVIELRRNVGYAKGKNIGVSKAKGKYILALDNDTAVTSNFLLPLVEDLEKDSSIGIVQPQIRSMIKSNLLDSVCAFLTFTGFLYYIGHMKSYKKAIYSQPIFGYSIKGACFLMRKKDYLSLGGLDETFISYVEETDLCHRVWLNGKKVLYDPKSVIYHWGGGDTQIMEANEASIFRSFKNRIVSYLKNLSVIELVKILPVHIIFSELIIMAFLLRFQFKKAVAVQYGVIYPFLHLESIFEKRAYIQKKIRKVNDRDINRFIMRNPRPAYYWQSISSDDLRNYKD